MTKMTVWDFDEDMVKRTLRVDGECDKQVYVIAPLESMTTFWQPYFRCAKCKTHFDPKSTAVALNDSVLIPCYSCESVIRRKYMT